jgi:ZIP family zinc transporter
MGLGALFGAWAGRISAVFIAICLAVAGGAMLYVIFADMIPESKRTYSGRFGSVGSILGIISGIIVSVQLNS